jgi:hypothetical protein
MGKAAYQKTVEVSSDGETNWLKLPATSPSMEVGGDVLDDTTLANNEGYRKRVLGLNDFSVSADSNWSGGDPALDLVLNAKLGRLPLFVRYLPDGTTEYGLQGPVVVENYNQAGDVGDLETVAISLQGNGPLVSTNP